jgi:hypothetical protein
MSRPLPVQLGDDLNCARCGLRQTARIAIPADQLLRQCSLCDGSEFFIRKDFPQKIGLLLVILFALVASVFYYFNNVPATFATLASLVLIDAVIYLFVGKVTVCYRCRAEYRGLPIDPAHEGFDLATSEKYSAHKQT